MTTTAWLTQITPDTRNPDARHDLADAVRMHQRVMTLAPNDLGDNPRQQAGVLYRIEPARTGPRILIQTGIPPLLARIPPAYGQSSSKDLTRLLTWLQQGALVRYRITANPIKRHGHTSIPLRGPAADDWWTRRAPQAGLTLRTIASLSLPDVVGRNHQAEIRHAVSQFDGLAIVTDPDTLRDAITAGVGRGRSHGCGLLSIAPAPTAVATTLPSRQSQSHDTHAGQKECSPHTRG